METAFLNTLSDTDLLAGVQRLVDGEHRTIAALVAHLAEFENRKLHLREGCASMFVYCTRVLHLSEHAAYHRIAAARLARRFPAVLAGLERGDLHVTALELLAPHLTPENHRELLAAAKHKSKREILELIAGVNPKADVAAGVRKVATKPTPVPARNAAAHGQGPAAHAATASDTSEQTSSAAADGGLFVLAPPAVPRKAEIVPLAPERYKVQFTASADTCNKLRRAQELLRHRIPNGDVAAGSIRRSTCWCGISNARNSRPRIAHGAPRRTRSKLPRRPGRRPVLQGPAIQSRRSNARVHGTFLRKSNGSFGNGIRGAARL